LPPSSIHSLPHLRSRLRPRQPTSGIALRFSCHRWRYTTEVIGYFQRFDIE
jgi:hypothetical protein